MMIVKIEIESDFRVHIKDTTWIISLKKGILNQYDNHLRDNNIVYDKDLVASSGIRTINGKLEFWDTDHWVAAREEIQKVYSDHMADKELLGDNTNDNR